MRLGVIADIHSNRAALEAVLEALDRARVDEMVCLGDVVSLGPHPRAVLARMREVGCPVVMGNCDAFMLEPVVVEGDDDAARITASDGWTASQLTDADLDFISTFRATLELTVGAMSLLSYHGSPRSFDDNIAPSSSDEDIGAFLEGYNADLYAGGHTHWPMFRRWGDSVVINPGSVGMAYDRTHPIEKVKCAPWAEFAVVDTADDMLDVSLRRVPYDSRSVAPAIIASGMPHAEWIADGWA